MERVKHERHQVSLSHLCLSFFLSFFLFFSSPSFRSVLNKKLKLSLSVSPCLCLCLSLSLSPSLPLIFNLKINICSRACRLGHITLIISSYQDEFLVSEFQPTESILRFCSGSMTTEMRRLTGFRAAWHTRLLQCLAAIWL